VDFEAERSLYLWEKEYEELRGFIGGVQVEKDGGWGVHCEILVGEGVVMQREALNHSHQETQNHQSNEENVVFRCVSSAQTLCRTIKYIPWWCKVTEASC
jgi:hypothetical protein